MIHCYRNLVPLQIGEERCWVKEATGQLSHPTSLNMVLNALEILNHNCKQGLKMFKSRKKKC